MNSIGERLNQFETGFLNRIGHYPGASTVTGSVRSLLGVAELVAGVAGVALLLLGFILIVPAILDFTLNREDPLLKRLSRLTSNCLMQGSSNLGRGLVEVVPGLNLLTYFYDRQGLRLDCLPYDEGVALLPSPSLNDDNNDEQLFPRNCIACKHLDGEYSEVFVTLSTDANRYCLFLSGEDFDDFLFDGVKTSESSESVDF